MRFGGKAPGPATNRQNCVHLISRVYLFYLTLARDLRCVRKPFNVFFLYVHVFPLDDDFFSLRIFFLTLFKNFFYFFFEIVFKKLGDNSNL